MTHSILDSMFPRMNIFNTKNVKWVSGEGKLKAKLPKNLDFFYIVYCMQVELRHDK